MDTLITASPDFFKKKSPKEIQEFFQRAADFLIGRVGKENIVSAVVHMDEKDVYKRQVIKNCTGSLAVSGADNLIIFCC